MTEGVTVKMNQARLDARYAKGTTQTQRMLDIQVAKDTDPFVPMLSGFLAMWQVLTTIGSGLIVYRGPYAKAQYYGLPNKTKTRHPQATMRWFEVSKSKNRASWLRQAKSEFKGNF